MLGGRTLCAGDLWGERGCWLRAGATASRTKAGDNRTGCTGEGWRGVAAEGGGEEKGEAEEGGVRSEELEGWQAAEKRRDEELLSTHFTR